MTHIRDWAVYSVAVYVGLLLGGAMIAPEPTHSAASRSGGIVVERVRPLDGCARCRGVSCVDEAWSVEAEAAARAVGTESTPRRGG